MGANSKIEWTHHTFNPWSGCTKVSPGCANCYAANAMPSARRFAVWGDGEEYALVDIGMRMLQPRELARAQGFPDSYILTGTKSEQVARIGNSVCPPVAEALVRAQFPELARRAA